MDGRTVHDLPWDQPFRYRDLECEATPTGPAGQQVFMYYVIWGLKHLLAETDYYRGFLVWDDQHRSWRLPFAFLPATDISPPVFFSLTWRKSDQGWKTSATPPQSATRQRGLAYSASCLGSCYVAIPYPSALVDSTSSRMVTASSLVSRCASRGLPEFRHLEEASE